MGLPEFPVEGGCQCGAVRYRLKASPLSVYNCHCKDCQRFSGAAWSMSMIVRDGDFAVSGKTDRYERVAESGNVIGMNFCANCHGWLWNDPPSPGIKVVRAGTLDASDRVDTPLHIWTKRQQPWLVLPAGAESYPEAAPPSPDRPACRHAPL